MKVLSMFLSSLVSAVIAFADAPVPTDPFYSDADGYTGDRTLARLVSSGGSNTKPDYGCTNAYCWGGVSLTDDCDCLVVSNKTMYPMNIELTEGRPFPGHSLQFGISDTYSKAAAKGNLYMYCRYQKNPFIVNGDLIFVNGDLMMRYVSDSYVRAGKVSVWTPADHPLSIYPNSVGEADRGNVCSLQFNAPVVSPATAGLLVYNGKPGFDVSLDLAFGGDMSAYLGSVTVTSYWDLAIGDWTKTMLTVTNTTIAGAVTMHAGTTLKSLVAGEPFGIGDLTLAGGSTVVLTGDLTVDNLVTEGDVMVLVSVTSTSAPKIAVRESASIGGKLRFVVSGYEAVPEGLTAPLLTLPEGSGVTDDLIELTDTTAGVLPFDDGRLVIREDGRAVSLVYDPQVTLDVTDNSSRVAEFPSALTNDVCWSDQRFPHDHAHYVLLGTGGGDSTTMRLRSYDDNLASKGEPVVDYTFPGESLTLDKYAALLLFGRTFTCKRVCVLRTSNNIQGSVYGHSILDAPIYLAPKSAFSSLLYMNALLTFAGELSGTGAIALNGHKGSSTKTPGASFALAAINTNFTGTIEVSITPDQNTTEDRWTPQFDPSLNKFATLYVNDGRNLGGPTVPANPKAVTLQNMCRLAVADGATDVTIDEPTRGIFVNWCGRFYVPEADETLTLKSPLAVHGEIHKEGDGLLVLANPQPTFGKAATATTPDAESTNRMFVVDGGNVKVASAYALNGLDIVNVNDASRFVLDADTADETLATYGLIDTLTPGTPFAVGGTASKVKFAVTVPEKPAWDEKTVALCTVKATDSAAVEEVLGFASVDNPGKVRIRSIEPVRTVLDGVECVTFKATVTGPQGLMMLVR